MGMSASQMRYCMLTGKKSDVEFQGQQINQQRTTLATETSQLNTQLLNLTVPTPPSSDSYTKTTYTFSANGQARTVAGTQYKSNDYYVDANGNVIDGTAPNGSGLSQYYAGSYIVNYTSDATTSMGKSSGSSLFSSTLTNGTTIYRTSGGTILSRVITDPTDSDYDSTDISNINKICKDCDVEDAAGNNYGDPAYATPQFYKITSSNGTTKYVLESELQTYANTTQNIPTYYVDDDATQTNNYSMYGCNVEWSASNRMTCITDSEGVPYTLSVTSTSDETAYQDAYNEYVYQKNLYEQSMDKINSEICIIQSDDKKLELKLQDLDTQQQALSTEMESVKKVIDKNVESSFKIFA